MSPRVKAVLGVGVLALLPLCSGPYSWCVTEWGYHRVNVGMSLADVESVLGPGRRTEAPTKVDASGPGKPRVDGDECYLWEPECSMDIYVGFRNGKVCDRWRDPSP